MYNYNRYMVNDYFRDTTPSMLNNNQTFNNNKLNLSVTISIVVY